VNFFDRTNDILDVGISVKATLITIAALTIGAIGAAVYAALKYL
jgi:hypothetical protein